MGFFMFRAFVLTVRAVRFIEDGHHEKCLNRMKIIVGACEMILSPRSKKAKSVRAQNQSLLILPKIFFKLILNLIPHLNLFLYDFATSSLEKYFSFIKILYPRNASKKT